VDCQEMTRLGGIGLKLTPNPRDVRINCSGPRVEVVTPSGVQNSITSERAINIRKKVQKQVIFGRRYFHNLAATGDLARPTSTVTSAKRNIWSTTLLDLVGETAFP
jgi:hypothetical protein